MGTSAHLRVRRFRARAYPGQGQTGHGAGGHKGQQPQVGAAQGPDLGPVESVAHVGEKRGRGPEQGQRAEQDGKTGLKKYPERNDDDGEVPQHELDAAGHLAHPWQTCQPTQFGLTARDQ